MQASQSENKGLQHYGQAREKGGGATTEATTQNAETGCQDAALAPGATRQKLADEAKMKNRTEGKPAIMKLLEELYNDEETGFGSKRELYEQATEKNPLVTMEMVNEFFRKEGSAQGTVPGRRRVH